MTTNTAQYPEANSLSNNNIMKQPAETVLNLFFDLPGAMICILNANGFFERLSKGFEEILGWRDQELKSKPYIDFVHSEDLAAIQEKIASLGDDKQTVQFEHRFQCKDGQYKWLSWSAQSAGDGLLYAMAQDMAGETSDHKPVQDAVNNALDQTEKRALQLDELNALSLSLSHSRDNPSIFKEVVEKTKSIIGCDRASVALIDEREGIFELFAVRGVESNLPSGVKAPLAGSSIEMVMKARHVIINSDPGEEFSRDGIQTTMNAPLIIDGAVIGALNAASKVAQAFGPAEERLMRQIASMLASVLENRRLLNQTEAVLSETHQLYQASAALNASENYEEILNVVREYTSASEAESVGIGYFGEGTTLTDAFPAKFDILASWQPHVADIFKLHYTRDELPTIDQIIRPELVVYDNIQQTPMGPEIRAIFDQIGAVSVIFAPLSTANQWLGFLSIMFARQLNLSETELQQISSLASQASIAVQNLYNLEASQRRAQRERTIREITEAMQSANNLEHLVQLTTEALGEHFSADLAIVELGGGIGDKKTAVPAAENLALPETDTLS